MLKFCARKNWKLLEVVDRKNVLYQASLSEINYLLTG